MRLVLTRLHPTTSAKVNEVESVSPMRDSLLRREVPVATNHRLIARKSVRRRSGSGSSALQETARASATTTLKKSKEPSFKEFHFTPTTMKLPLPVFRPLHRGPGPRTSREESPPRERWGRPQCGQMKNIRKDQRHWRVAAASGVLLQRLPPVSDITD